MEFRQHKDSDKVHSTRYYSKRQENAVAKEVNGKTTPNSGATPYIKGDIATDDFLIECKTCVKDQKSFTIQKNWFEKNRDESIFMKIPHNCVVFSFGPNSENYYVVNEADFLVMRKLLQLYENGKIDVDLD